MRPMSRGRSPELGAATLGECGALAHARRGSDRPGPGPRWPRRPSRCGARRGTTSPSTWRVTTRPGRLRPGRRRGRRPRPRLLGRGPDHRGPGPRAWPAWSSTEVSATWPPSERLGFPVFSSDRRAPWGDQAVPGHGRVHHRGGRGPGRRGATGWSVTSTAWWWCPARRSTRSSPPAGRGPTPRPATSPPSAGGATTVDLLGLDASLVEVGPPD